jgi:hypothetical protein
MGNQKARCESSATVHGSHESFWVGISRLIPYRAFLLARDT